MSLTWCIASERVRIGFDHLDELGEIVHATVREGRYRLFPWAEDGEAVSFGSISKLISCSRSSSSPSISATRLIVKTWLVPAMVKPAIGPRVER
jgi:hypothetical protein